MLDHLHNRRFMKIIRESLVRPRTGAQCARDEERPSTGIILIVTFTWKPPNCVALENESKRNRPVGQTCLNIWQSKWNVCEHVVGNSKDYLIGQTNTMNALPVQVNSVAGDFYSNAFESPSPSPSK